MKKEAIALSNTTFQGAKSGLWYQANAGTKLIEHTPGDFNEVAGRVVEIESTIETEPIKPPKRAKK
jgi:hypothetical protein